jgi:hypothetical protein
MPASSYRRLGARPRAVGLSRRMEQILRLWAWSPAPDDGHQQASRRSDFALLAPPCPPRGTHEG